MIYQALDYRLLLIENYKKLGLNETEVTTLLVIDLLIKQGNNLITQDLLALKMPLESEIIDKTLVSLINKGLLSFGLTEGETSKSLDPLKKQLYHEFVVALNREQNENDPDRQTSLSRIFEAFQKEWGRNLTPTEVQAIREWLANGYSEQTIIDALLEPSGKKRKTIRSIDKRLLKWSTSNDIRKEGFSAQTEAWRENIDQTVEVAKKQWFGDDDE